MILTLTIRIKKSGDGPLTAEDLCRLKTIFEQLVARAARQTGKIDSMELTMESIQKVTDLVN